MVRPPALSTGGALTLALAPTHVFVLLLWPGPLLSHELKLFQLELKVLTPSCVPSISEIGRPCRPMAVAARTCQPMVVAARPY